jgi:hypothetical protein
LSVAHEPVPTHIVAVANNPPPLSQNGFHAIFRQEAPIALRHNAEWLLMKHRGEFNCNSDIPQERLGFIRAHAH